MEMKEYVDAIINAHMEYYFISPETGLAAIDGAHAYMIADPQMKDVEGFKNTMETWHDGKIAESESAVRIPQLTFKGSIELQMGDISQFFLPTAMQNDFDNFFINSQKDIAILGYYTDKIEKTLSHTIVRKSGGGDMASFYPSHTVSVCMKFLKAFNPARITIRFSDDYPMAIETERIRILIACRMDENETASGLKEIWKQVSYISDTASYETEE